MCLTQTVRYCGNWWKNSVDRFEYHTDPKILPAVNESIGPSCRRIISILFNLAEDYFSSRGLDKRVNYEDIYYLASQLRDDVTESENPALLPLIMHYLREKLLELQTPEKCREYDDLNTFHELYLSKLEYTCGYIEDIVITLLYKMPGDFAHLKIIPAIHLASDLSLGGIATLAHDTHVEAYLRDEGFKLADGFNSVPTKVSITNGASTAVCMRLWENDFSIGDRIPFLKLHGSIDWKKVRNINSGESSIGIRGGPKKDIPVDGNEADMSGDWKMDRDERPLLLVGTFNKKSTYVDGGDA